MTTVATVLANARQLLLASRYQRHYTAMNVAGRACSPRDPNVALSLSGALLACSTSYEHSEVVRWLRYHHLLPQAEPASKAAAIELLDKALSLIGGRKAA